ncbi:TerB family tellurite resistance protein [Thermodesulfobacteriota bacterium]
MTSSLNSTISDAFDEENQQILNNEHQFKIKLKIGENTHQHLSKVKKVVTIGTISSIAIGSGAITNAAWLSSLGVFGKTAFLLGIGSNPYGWIVGVGVGTALGAYGIKKLINSADNSTTHKIPKYINGDIDIVALCVSDLLFPPAVMIACTDQDFCNKERKCIVDYFVDEYGYDKNFVQNTIAFIEKNVKSVDYRELKKSIVEVCNTNKDLDKDVIINDLLKVLQEVAQADGVIHPNENTELKLANTYLKKK